MTAAHPAIGPTTSTTAPRLSREAVAWWGFGLAAFYAIAVRFYQGAGGTIGMTGTMPPEHQRGLQMASYIAGLTILVGGLACLYLALPAVRRIPRWFPVGGGREIPAAVLRPLCLAPSLIGATYGLGHGVGGMITKTLALAGVVEVPYPDTWLTLDETASAWWDLLLYEPWFIGFSTFLLLSALRYMRDTGRPGTVRLTARIAAGGAVVVAASIVWMTATDTLLVI